MFISIDTNGATNIIISIPADKAEKSIGAITRMFEENAVFIKDDYNKISQVKPYSKVILGNEFKGEKSQGYSEKPILYTVTSSENVIETFEPANNELFVSFEEYKKGKEEKVKSLTDKIIEHEKTIENLKNKIDALISIDSSEQDED